MWTDKGFLILVAIVLTPVVIMLTRMVHEDFGSWPIATGVVAGGTIWGVLFALGLHLEAQEDSGCGKEKRCPPTPQDNQAGPETGLPPPGASPGVNNR